MPIASYTNKSEIPETEVESLILILTNGDKAALDQVIARWNFLDAESFLKFVIAIMIKAEGNKITIQVGGEQSAVGPNDNLLRR